MRIGNCTQAFEWCHFQWLWTLNDLKTRFQGHTIELFNTEYLRSSTRYRHNYIEILIGMPLSRVSFWMTLSNLEWLSEIFNDTKQFAWAGHANWLFSSYTEDVSCWLVLGTLSALEALFATMRYIKWHLHLHYKASCGLSASAELLVFVWCWSWNMQENFVSRPGQRPWHLVLRPKL